MNLRGSRLLQHLDDIGTGRSPHNRIIHHDDPLASHHFLDHIELDLDTALPLALSGLDERPPHIAVLVERHPVRDPRLLGIPLCRDQPRIRHADHQVRFHRERLCQGLSRSDPRMIDVDPVQGTVRSREINILKYTPCLTHRIDSH